ncbi:M10 family metallopeptidase [Pseudomonas sp. L13]|uniref:M10 family metallopeptidase n=1 Tax=Pseudomonas sp. L13 TaxID=343985 RepID=UPI00137A93D6|nr:M10 family metallopeptidase [Pseudomonas sp. L13]
MANNSSANISLDDFLYENFRGSSKVSEKGLVSKTIDEAVAIISREGKSWIAVKKIPAGETVNVTYAFAKANDAGLENPSDKFKLAYKEALGRVSDVANITFSEADINKGGDITVRYTGNGGTSSSTFPGNGTWTRFDSDISSDLKTFSSRGIHEVGHSVGLSHPGDYDSVSGVAAHRAYLEDDTYYTVMSYNTTRYSDDNQGRPATYGIDDIATLQKLYGANNQTRSTDTTYGFHSNIQEKSFLKFYSLTESTASLKAPYTIWDAGGSDTLDFSGFSQDQRITLRDGELSDVGGMHFGVGIAQGAVIENASGGSGNDIIIGNNANNYIAGHAGNDVIYGAAGADTLSGGEGNDTFVYRSNADSSLTSLGQKPDGSAINSLADIDLSKLIGSIDTISDFNSGQDKIDLSFLRIDEGNAVKLQLVNTLPQHSGELALNYFEDTNITLLTSYVSDALPAPDFAVKIVGQVSFAHDIIA